MEAVRGQKHPSKAKNGMRELIYWKKFLTGQNCIDVNYEKTVGLGAWHTKALWKSNISLCLSQKEKSLVPKLTAWRPFILQNSNGRGRLNFWATPFKFWKSTNFLKLSKWFYYTKSKSLLVSEIKKLATSSLSIYRDLHGLFKTQNQTIFFSMKCHFALDMKQKLAK